MVSHVCHPYVSIIYKAPDIQEVKAIKKWQPVYTSGIPETAELQMNIGINEARDEMEWNWAVIEGQETMISGKGIKRRVE